MYFKNTKLGYVPKYKNSDVSNLLYFGYGDILCTKITNVNPEAEPERQFRIVINKG
jgi:hypothetical protein